ncbi:hypothetical protein Tco_1545406 [Tanacetum coccineum]
MPRNWIVVTPTSIFSSDNIIPYLATRETSVLARIGLKMVIIAFCKADGAFFLNQTALLSTGNDYLELDMGGGTTGLDESLLYTVDVEYGWGDACDKKAMHGCPWIKKAPVMETFSCPT